MKSFIELIVNLVQIFMSKAQARRMEPRIKKALAVKPKIVPKFRQSTEYYLDAEMMERFRQNWVDYKWAARVVGGIPAVAFGGVNFRETGGKREAKVYGGPGYQEKGNKRVSHLEGGWCQLDLGGSGAAHHKKLQQWANRACKKYGVTPGNLDIDFRTGCIVAAEILKTKAGKRSMMVDGKIQWENVAWALWGYNGRSSYHTPDGKKNETRRSYKYSPYVSNDTKRGFTLRIRGTMPLPEGMTTKKAIAKYGANRIDQKRRRLKIDRPDKRPGALIIAQELYDRRGELA